MESLPHSNGKREPSETARCGQDREACCDRVREKR
jgi:hypothetical protein